MRNTRINIYLIMTILTLSVSSLLVSYFLLDEILDSSISIGVNQKTSRILTEYKQDLKKLKALDPINEDRYKKNFYLVQESMVVFEHPTALVSLIKDSYIMYFLVVFVSILLLSLIASLILSRKVSLSYNSLLKSNIAKSNRLQSLEYFENWQHTAASLAHEIKNPLTPIEMMISNLTRTYQDNDTANFEKKLHLTQNIVLEEVHRLKNMVSHFHNFSKLPTPVLQVVNFIEFIRKEVDGYHTAWPDLKIDVLVSSKLIAINVKLDTLLFKQCVLNLVQNAIESNQNLKPMKIQLKFVIVDKTLIFSFMNNGIRLSEEQSKRLFQVGFSTKKQLNNSGLGLSIVKKIILEHNGNIKYIDSEFGVTFEIFLPIKSVEYQAG